MLELFVRLDDYFYTNPTENRIEGNMVGLILRDWSKIYTFCDESNQYVEKILTKVDEEYCLSLYDIYVKFVRASKSLVKFMPQ